jgi:hypothetical protein
MSDAEDQWWFCLKHLKVEHGPGCANKDRMGPYASQEAAAGALQTARERDEAWRRQDGALDD